MKTLKLFLIGLFITLSVNAQESHTTMVAFRENAVLYNSDGKLILEIKGLNDYFGWHPDYPSLNHYEYYHFKGDYNSLINLANYIEEAYNKNTKTGEFGSKKFGTHKILYQNYENSNIVFIYDDKFTYTQINPIKMVNALRYIASKVKK